jgi:hypothetical protein
MNDKIKSFSAKIQESFAVKLDEIADDNCTHL